MTTPPIAVTGSTGVVGGYVASTLAAAGVAQRLLVRTPAKAPALPDATVHPFSYSDKAASTAALAGVEVLFMVSAAESADRLDEHRAFIDSATAAGVKHIVYTSFFGASPNATFTLARDHDVTEKYIVASGIAHTFLRDNLYIDFMNELVGEDGVIRGPAGNGRASLIAREDIARVASIVLLDPKSHVNTTYDLTGREALTLDEVAAVLAEHRGTPVSYHDESISEAYESRARYGAPPWLNDAWVSTYTAIAAGEAERVSTAVADITGVEPLTLAEFLAQG